MAQATAVKYFYTKTNKFYVTTKSGVNYMLRAQVRRDQQVMMWNRIVANNYKINVKHWIKMEKKSKAECVEIAIAHNPELYRTAA